ncbi:MAG: hypothetical protein AB1698_10610 [Pseudomonadota bacterium]|uniref:hypothetical protein n=1 Tax=Aquabacter cavernae TaxID=2496029 RepID=UPI000F8EA475|nr:hypothetical protein [Aquabacter cavernae]MBA4790205.1 hypothetical protein [Hyphomicrobiales bacterium]
MNDKSNVTPLAAAKSTEKATSGKVGTVVASAEPKAVAASAPASDAGGGAKVKAAAVPAAPAAKTAWQDGPWQAVAAGEVVLIADNSDGEFQGWWPAKVISRSGDFVTCEFLGYESMGRFTKPLSALSLMHPAHKD